MKDTKYISDRIIETYLKRLDELSESKARHFLYRAYKATGCPELKKKLMNHSVAFTKRSATVEPYINNRENYIEYKYKKLQAKRIAKINDRNKNQQKKKHINLSAYNSFILQIYYLIALEIEEKVSIDLPDEEALKKELLSNPDYTKYATVSASNIVYLSKNLGLFDIEKEFLSIFNQVFNDNEIIEDDEIFTNYIYGLTHIAIVGASNYYSQKIDVDKYKWCAKHFDQYNELIYQRLSLDINAEVALCYKMLNRLDSDYIQKVTNRLCDRFNESEGYIHRESNNSFNFAEHTNAIALLLFNFDNLKLS